MLLRQRLAQPCHQSLKILQRTWSSLEVSETSETGIGRLNTFDTTFQKANIGLASICCLVKSKFEKSLLASAAESASCNLSMGWGVNSEVQWAATYLDAKTTKDQKKTWSSGKTRLKCIQCTVIWCCHIHSRSWFRHLGQTANLILLAAPQTVMPLSACLQPFTQSGYLLLGGDSRNVYIYMYINDIVQYVYIYTYDHIV